MTKIKKIISKNKTLSFIIILVFAILIARISVLIYDVTPKIAGFELHHFDYGLILLVISILLMLFTKIKQWIILVLSAISIGLIVDEVGYIRGNFNEAAIYDPYILSTVIIVILIIILILIMKHFKK